MVGKRAVELGEEEVHVEREGVEDLGGDEPAHPVGGVGHDAQGPQGGDVDEAPHVGGVLLEHVAPLVATRALRRRRDPVSQRFFGQLPDVDQTGVLADGPGPAETHLDAVVTGRVVRRREHGAGGVEATRGEVHEVGRDQAEVDDVGAGGCVLPVANALDNASPEAAHVPSDDHLRGPTETGKGPSNGPGRIVHRAGRAPCRARRRP